MSLLYWLLLAALVILIPTGYAGLIGAPYAPTRLPVVRRAFKRLNVGPKDTLIDLGVGDGSILIAAARRGARARGYELSPLMWLIAWVRNLRYPKTSVRYGNFYRRSFPEATIIFAFLMPKIMPRVQTWLAQQKFPHGKYFLAYAFPLPESIDPLYIIRAKNCAPLYVYDLKEISG